MKTDLTNQHRLMIITVVAGLILAAVAFLKPALAEAGVIVRARTAIAVAPDSPRGVIVQTGPRSYRCDIRVRPLRPLYGRFFWVPGHYEEILVKKHCRKAHRTAKFKPGKFKNRRPGFHYAKAGKRYPKVRRHDHFREVWVPGHWERI